MYSKKSPKWGFSFLYCYVIICIVFFYFLCVSMKKYLIGFGVIVFLGVGIWFIFKQTQTANITVSKGEIETCLENNLKGECYSVYLQKGIDAYVSNMSEESIAYFRAAQQVYDENKVAAFQAYRNEANAMYDLKDYDGALKLYKDLAEVNHTDTSQIYLDIIRVYSTQKEYEQAIIVAEEAFGMFPKRDVFLYKKAEMLEHLEKYGEEVAVYEVLLEMLPEKQESILFKIDRLKKVHNL